MTSADHRADPPTTANAEATRLINESDSLLQQFIDYAMSPEFQEVVERPAMACKTLEESIRLARKALEVAPDSPDLAFHYATLAMSIRLLVTYSPGGKTEAGTLDEVVDLSRLALRSYVGNRLEFRSSIWDTLALALQQRYVLYGSLDDLREAAQANRQAMETTEPGAVRVVSLQQLATCLSQMYENVRDSHNLEEAICVSRQGLEIAADNRDRFPFAVNLSRLLDRRYEGTGNVGDLHEAILMGKQAIEAMPKTPNVFYQRDGIIIENTLSPIAALQFLTELLMKRYTKTGTKGDLEQAVVYGKQAVDLMPDTIHKTRLLNSSSLRTASVHPESNPDRSETISLLNQILTTTLEGEDGVKFAMSVGRYANETSMSVSEMNQYILFLERQMEKFKGKLGLIDSVLMSTYVSRLFCIKFSKTGRVIDLERGIELAEEAVDKMMGHEDEHNQLYQLCILSLHVLLTFSSIEHGFKGQNVTVPDSSYERKRKQVLEKLSVASSRINSVPEHKLANTTSIDSHDFVKLCGIQLISDNDQAIVCMKEFIDTLSENTPLRALSCRTLAEKLLQKYQATKDLTILEEGIQAGRAALAASEVNAGPSWSQETINFSESLGLPLGIGLDRSFSSMLLSDCLLAKNLATGEMAALDEAVQRVVNDGGQPTAGRGIVRTVAASYLMKRYLSTGSTADLKTAFNQLRATLHDAHSTLLSRVVSFRSLVAIQFRLGHDEDIENLFQDAILAIGLIHRMLVRSLESSDNIHFLLSSAASVASDAAALALETDRSPMVALELLESGRGIAAASLQDLRDDAYNLEAQHPVLAERLTGLRKQLNTPAPPKVFMSIVLRPSHGGADVDQLDRHDQAAREFDTLVEEIRQLPGFRSYLGTPQDSDILAAARDGPIAVINASQIRCDALLVERDRVRSLPLPHLHLNDINEKAKSDNLGGSDILAWLWAAIAGPVLRALEFIQPLSTYKTLPRMWWITTGPLSRFPLHAAGYHGKRSDETVIDRVMSSYSCSIKAIISGRRRRASTAAALSMPGQALLVAMPQTRGYSTLRHSTDEIAKVREICTSMSFKTIELPSPRKPDVLRNLPDCSVFHFAGHAHADDSNPSNSQLYLHDWKDNPLRVSDLLNLDLHAHPPFLAYLSACDTGRIKDDSYLDESTHIINAFQLAGFRHVIGTLWDADDEWSVEMSRIAYEGMREGGLTDESVCRGLHKASRALRDLWVDQMRPEERVCGYDIEESVANGKRPMGIRIQTPEPQEFSEGEALVDNEKREAWLKDIMEKDRDSMIHAWTYGLLKYSNQSHRVRAVTRGASDVDSVGSSCSLPDLSDLDASTTSIWSLKPTQSQADLKTSTANPPNDLHVSSEEARASSSIDLGSLGTLQVTFEDLNSLFTRLGLQDRDQENLEASASSAPFWMSLGSVQGEGEAMGASPAHGGLESLFRAGSEHGKPLQEVFEAVAALNLPLDFPGGMQGSIDALSALTRAPRVNRGSRKVERDEGDVVEDGSKRPARPDWVPYVHFGV
ncbi:MAG: hypothetical protein MMC33_010189 [Icmadophila ericetorum]|nr:hypothetical protein [Icmadophila ericetorum]